MCIARYTAWRRRPAVPLHPISTWIFVPLCGQMDIRSDPRILSKRGTLPTCICPHGYFIYFSLSVFVSSEQRNKSPMGSAREMKLGILAISALTGLAIAITWTVSADARARKYSHSHTTVRDCTPFNAPGGYYGNIWCDTAKQSAQFQAVSGTNSRPVSRLHTTKIK